MGALRGSWTSAPTPAPADRSHSDSVPWGLMAGSWWQEDGSYHAGDGSGRWAVGGHEECWAAARAEGISEDSA